MLPWGTGAAFFILFTTIFLYLQTTSKEKKQVKGIVEIDGQQQ